MKNLKIIPYPISHKMQVQGLKVEMHNCLNLAYRFQSIDVLGLSSIYKYILKRSLENRIDNSILESLDNSQLLEAVLLELLL